MIYIFGHKKPDTDSVTAAISLSYLKNALGQKTKPMMLGHANDETKFALSYFGVKEPEYLNDVKLQLKDVNYHKGSFLHRHKSIADAVQYLTEQSLTGIPIVNDDKTFMGLVTLKDLARELIGGNVKRICSSYTNILTTLEGKELVKIDEEIEGDLLIASYDSKTILNEVIFPNDTILLVGNRNDIIEYAIKSKIKMLVVTGDKPLDQELIDLAKKNEVNIIQSLMDTLHTVKKISFANYIETMIVRREAVTFEENDYVDDFIETNNKLKHTNYPILDKKGICLGLLKLTDLNDKKKKQVILVDHNECAQSADGIDEAEILEVIDHHSIGSITTSSPINFRGMIVGSSNTIIYQLYQEAGVKIPKEVAGLMLSGILSDTLIFKSPTTTEYDKIAGAALAKIAEVDLEYYGFELIKAGTSLKGKTKEEILYGDFKIFKIKEKNICIGQAITLDFEEIQKEISEYVTLLDKVAEQNDYYVVFLYFTDIIKNGSYVLYSSKGSDILEQGYNIKEIHQGYYLDGCVSRKKQMLPNIIDALDGK